jgi:hypothetical protein
MKARSICEITVRPVPQTTNQTVGAVSNVNLTEQKDLTSDVSRANTTVDIFSPATSASTDAPERVHQGHLNPVPPSSKNLFPHSHHTTVCVISPPSVRLSEDIFIEQVVDDSKDDLHIQHDFPLGLMEITDEYIVDDSEDDLHIQHDFPLGLMEITDEYIHAVHIIPHIKTNGHIQFRALKLDSSLPNKMEDSADRSCTSFRTTHHPTSWRTKKDTQEPTVPGIRDVNDRTRSND